MIFRIKINFKNIQTYNKNNQIQIKHNLIIIKCQLICLQLQEFYKIHTVLLKFGQLEILIYNK
jgi:hypothetical protein